MKETNKRKKDLNTKIYKNLVKLERGRGNALFRILYKEGIIQEKETWFRLLVSISVKNMQEKNAIIII